MDDKRMEPGDSGKANDMRERETGLEAMDDGGREPSGFPPERNFSRDELSLRVAAWVREVLQDEEPPHGLDAEILHRVLEGTETGPEPESTTDAFSLWSALTALTQEIKLQGRTFKQLHDDLEPVLGSGSMEAGPTQPLAEPLGTVREIVHQLGNFKTNREREIRAETERRVRQEMIGVLLDMRDRLVRGLEADRTDADEFTPSWIDRLLGRSESIARFLTGHAGRKKGYQLSLERLEDALRSYGVREITCQGQPFDPRSMNVVEVEETTDRPDGQVIEVYQPGYEWNGQVFRTAQVKVARQGGAEK